ncbi:hypothetical protein Gpo141_00013170 [Globisporangium polare]
MQFRAVLRYDEPELPSSSVTLHRPRDHHHEDGGVDTTTRVATGDVFQSGHLKKPPHQTAALSVHAQQHLQPGSLLSIKRVSNNGNGSQSQLKLAPSPATKKTSKKSVSTTTHTKAIQSSGSHYQDLTPEPINYIKLRRTEQSKQALLRNRQVVQEILTPTLSPTHRKDGKKDKQQQQQEQGPIQFYQPQLPGQQNVILDDLKRRFRDKGQVDSAAIATEMQALYREQSKVAAQAKQVSAQLQHLLTDIRNDISLMCKFTPLFKIYTRHKLTSRWSHWCAYTEWHRLEQQRLEQLVPYAAHIQRVFRRKRSQWQRARERLTTAWSYWQAAIVLQCWMKNWFRAQAQARRRETLYAARLQAAWRSRTVRRQVKKALQDQLRWLLASLTPTGNLHRLHDVITRSQRPEFAQKISHMLSLIAETHVTMDIGGGGKAHQHKPRHAMIAAKHYLQPVEATRKELFHAIHELKCIVAQREQGVATAKQAFLDEQHAKKAERELHETKLKHKQLCAIKARIAADNERNAMEKIELETREYVRQVKTAEADMMLRRKLNATRHEQAENTLMVIEEYQTRYQVAESRRRELESKKRLNEVVKRDQFRHDQAQSQLAEFLEIMKNDELKRLECQQKQKEAKVATQEKWAHLSKDERAQALRRLEQRDQQQLMQQRELEAHKLALEVAMSDAKRRKDEQRAMHQAELEQELSERNAMAQEEKLVRRWHFAMRKSSQSSNWLEKREKEKVKYSIDPMHFAKVQLQKEQEERERKESYLMRQEDALGTAVREKERKEQYFQLCRGIKRLRLIDEAKERKERLLMEKEELLAIEKCNALRKAQEYQIQLQRMQELAEKDHRRERDRLLEAKSRKEMHDEELRQLRVQQTLEFLDGVREKHERQNMEEQEKTQRLVDAKRARKDEKRLCAKVNLRMMKEDVESMERQEYEDEGLRLEQLLWSPLEAAAFAHFVSHHCEFLCENVQVLKELMGSESGGEKMKSPPPFELDYEAVRAHLDHEQELPMDKVPPKKRKPRKFFYHEFFEDDPILTRKPLPPLAAVTEEEIKAQKVKLQARERWKMLGSHFFGHMWRSKAARRGYLQMHNQQYEAACTSLLEAVHGNQQAMISSSSLLPHKPVSAALLRQLSRCYLKLWETRAQRRWLEKSLFFLQQSSAHVLLLTSPSFLQEIAFVLEQMGSYRHAAEVLGGIIQCFPRYARLAQVIFRGAVVMFALQMYHQAREYLLHVLDARPFDWEPSEIQFLVARVLQFEGKLSKKLCAVAYEDAFQKRSKLRGAHYQSYPTWNEWIKSADTWRRFGDKCMEKREFVLAKDAYQLMLKRQIEKPAHLVSKRQQVRQHQGHVRKQINDDEDWLRLARVSAALNDRSRSVLALSRWFETKNYRERVRERYCAWPLVRWKLLGLEIPESVVRAREESKRANEDAETQLRQEVEEQRQQVLRKRSYKRRAVMKAWQEEEGGATASDAVVSSSSAQTFQTAEVQQWPSAAAATARDPAQIEKPWHCIADTEANQVYYWNEDTDETSYDPPVHY